MFIRNLVANIHYFFEIDEEVRKKMRFPQQSDTFHKINVMENLADS